MKSSFLADFKKFAMRGNVIDMAVGVIIGGAFGKIVSSVVADIIMPPLGLLIGGVNFTDLKWVMKGPEVVDGVEQAAVTLNYGNFLQATIPGNHEYYFSSNGSYISNEIYNQFYNNPTNGPSDRLGSSYYFVWDQFLFIMLDTVKTDYNVAQQQEWFRNVVKNNPTQWIIVGSHPGLYATGAYESDAQIMRRNWLDLFEECQVDIALNGHEHVYARKNLRYNGNSNS